MSLSLIPQDPPSPTALARIPAPDAPLPLDGVIALWLDAKVARTQSQRTARAYRDTLAAFRAALHAHGADLDCPDTRAVSLFAQTWCARPRPDGRPVAANTHNQRLTILASFYSFARRRGLLQCDNPIEALDRRPVTAYGAAQPLDAADLAARLTAIDRRTPLGLRDYALLALAVQTGRRLSELAAVRVGDLQLRHLTRVPAVTVQWPRAKGGKRFSDTLPPAVGRALVAWLTHLYGLPDLAAQQVPADAPVWVSLATNGTAGHALSLQAIADLCAKRIGTSKVHTLRHTFAHGMEEVGAKVSEIQARLGHANLATTGRYLAQLRKAENPHAEAIATLFGLQPAPAPQRPERPTRPVRDTRPRTRDRTRPT